jgi:hypothetical protein
MRVVIGSGRNRQTFEVPLNGRERQAMADEINLILFRKRN